ncbi:MAG: hypothetical protein QHH07_02210 [Sedimentisphaerales bacterium]|jgi:hypothetical protein|nr:hypothetical protein [Sedimentisphaerales bacterium]
MWNVFETPYLLLILAVFVHMAVLVFRAIRPDKQRPWQWAIPLAVVCLAFGMDLAVATDREQINALLNKAVKAAEREDVTTIADILAEDYSDSLHPSKDQLLRHARMAFASSPLAKLTSLGKGIGELGRQRSMVAISVMANFEPNSLVAQNYKPVVLAVAQLVLAKHRGRWLIRSIELTEVDKNPVGWSQVSGQY